MTRTRIIVAALAALALAAPAASADPHAIDAHNRAQLEKQDLRSADAIDSATQAELRARGRDGAQTSSPDATKRALEQERAYSTYGEPTPIPPASAPTPVTADDGAPWAIIAFGIACAALLAAGVAVTARRSRVAT
jgi:hypothetical protein